MTLFNIPKNLEKAFAFFIQEKNIEITMKKVESEKISGVGFSLDTQAKSQLTIIADHEFVYFIKRYSTFKEEVSTINQSDLDFLINTILMEVKDCIKEVQFVNPLWAELLVEYGYMEKKVIPERVEYIL